MTPRASILAAEVVVPDPRWLPHRFDDAEHAIEFVRLERSDHDKVPFLEDQYLRDRFPRALVPLSKVRLAVSRLPMAASPRFLFHSTMAASTLTARLFDQPSLSMGLKEPMILNQIAAVTRRGADAKPLLDLVLTLLARPFGSGEAVMVKPGNVANLLISQIMALRRSAKVIFLHAPLRHFLRSIAKKGLSGRIFYRRLFATLQKEGQLDTGFSERDLFEQTDLQIAAMVWLSHHAQFAKLAIATDGRVRTLDSVVLLDDKARAIEALASHFELSIDLPKILASPMFSQHAKELGRNFDTSDRQREHEATEAAYGDEIGMVEGWAKAVAAHCGVPLELPAPLLPRV